MRPGETHGQLLRCAIRRRYQRRRGRERVAVEHAEIDQVRRRAHQAIRAHRDDACFEGPLDARIERDHFGRTVDADLAHPRVDREGRVGRFLEDVTDGAGHGAPREGEVFPRVELRCVQRWVQGCSARHAGTGTSDGEASR